MAPKVSGYIRDVRVRDNQQVKAGDLLATLDDRDYRVALESAEANLQLSEAKLAGIQAQREQQQAVIAQNRAAVNASRDAQLRRAKRRALSPPVAERNRHRRRAAESQLGDALRHGAG